MIEFTENEDSIIFGVRAIPRSSGSEIVGEYNQKLKVRLASAPVDGAANRELIRIISKYFRVPKSRIEILSGESSKTKRIRIRGIDARRFLGLIY